MRLVWLVRHISEVVLVVGLLHCNRLTLLPPEVSEGSAGVILVSLVSFPCHTTSTREYTAVSFPCHTPSTPVSFSGHTQFSRHTRVSGDQAATDE